MKYYVIEIVKPGAVDYTARLAQKVAEGDFEVVAVCESQEEADTILVRFNITNIKKQSGLHYEILPENSNHHLLAKEIEDTPAQLMRGGARPGAGRKPKNPEQGNKKQASWWLALDVLAIIKEQPNQAEYIEKAIRLLNSLK